MLLPVLQITEPRLRYETPGKFEMARADNLGKIYLIWDQEIKQYDTDGKLINRNSDKWLGRIYDLDATNALELLVYYQDQAQVVFYDNQLAAKGRTISLEQLGFEQVSEVCSSYGNGLWLYDRVKFELVRLDKQNNFTVRTGNLYPVLGFVPRPVHMREAGNRLYVSDPAHGILVFDIYGTYYNTLPIKDIGFFQVYMNGLFYLKDTHLLRYDFIEMQTDTVMHYSGVPRQMLYNEKWAGALLPASFRLYDFR
jgi:hypothetical protein